jgi:hypothetical protein
MTLYEFLALDEKDKAKEVWKGAFITFREETGSTIMLYQVHSFYVEVYYSKCENEIIKFNPFSSSARLAYYFQSCLN